MKRFIASVIFALAAGVIPNSYSAHSAYAVSAYVDYANEKSVIIRYIKDVRYIAESNKVEGVVVEAEVEEALEALPEFTADITARIKLLVTDGVKLSSVQQANLALAMYNENAKQVAAGLAKKLSFLSSVLGEVSNQVSTGNYDAQSYKEDVNILSSKMNALQSQYTTAIAAANATLESYGVAVADAINAAMVESTAAQGKAASDISALSSRVQELEDTGGNSSALRAQLTEIKAQLRDIASWRAKVNQFMERCEFARLMSGFMTFPLSPVTMNVTNQFDILTKFLGNASTNAAEGTFTPPTAQIGSNAGNVTTSIFELLWENGFIPWLPPEAGEYCPNQQAKEIFSGRQIYMEQVVANGQTNYITHAVGVDMPQEWGFLPWSIRNGAWVNAAVIFTDVSVPFSGLAPIDGQNWLRVNVVAQTASIVNAVPQSREKDVCYFYLGTYSSATGELTDATHITPICLVWMTK